MPLRTGVDAKGRYWVWGTRGKKYYGSTAKSRARSQMMAVIIANEKKKKNR
jgi:hypothetical protein